MVRGVSAMGIPGSGAQPKSKAEILRMVADILILPHGDNKALGYYANEFQHMNLGNQELESAVQKAVGPFLKDEEAPGAREKMQFGILKALVDPREGLNLTANEALSLTVLSVINLCPPDELAQNGVTYKGKMDTFLKGTHLAGLDGQDDMRGVGIQFDLVLKHMASHSNETVAQAAEATGVYGRAGGDVNF